VIRRGSPWLINLRSIFWYFVNHNRFDLVVDFTNKLPYSTPLYVWRKLHLAITLDVFGEMLIKEFGLFGYFLAYFQRLILKFYKKTNFITTSYCTKNELIDVGIKPEKIEIIYQGTDFIKYHPGKKSKTPLLIYVGRLQKYKRVDIAIMAFKKIKNCCRNLQFVIIGTGKDLPRLKKITKSGGLSSKVKFLGFVSEKEKVAWYQKAWLNVQPSIKEGWGLSVLEAGDCGVPTIAANVPGLCEAVVDGKTGWLFEKNNLDEFSAKLRNVLLNEKMLNKAGAMALKHSRKFNWDLTAQLVEAKISRPIKKIKKFIK
jgi:glycosyltransferase involved in cell wall biosynthesis